MWTLRAQGMPNKILPIEISKMFRYKNLQQAILKSSTEANIGWSGFCLKYVEIFVVEKWRDPSTLGGTQWKTETLKFAVNNGKSVVEVTQKHGSSPARKPSLTRR